MQGCGSSGQGKGKGADYRLEGVEGGCLGLGCRPLDVLRERPTMGPSSHLVRICPHGLSPLLCYVMFVLMMCH